MYLPNPQIVEINVKNDALHGLKILHLSDLHIHQKTSEHTVLKLIELCHNLEYDVAIITGDIIDCKPKFIEKQLKALNTLKKAYYISGNHDLFYGINPLMNLLSNFTFLDNTHHFIEHHQQKIALVGLSDRFSRFFNVKRDEKKIIGILENTPNCIFVSHQPKDYGIAVNTNTALFLCGHTHGGQVFPFHYVVKLFQPFLAGLFYVKNSAIYVNKGLGTWGINLRYKANSEITILHLSKN
jgi:predicted MPP superfamily phosphohydrolase